MWNFLKTLFTRIIKILFKHLLICILIAYTPLPFSDIWSFYNQDPESVDSDSNNSNKDKYFKLKIVIFGIIFCIICYIIYKSNTEGGNSGNIEIPDNKAQSQIENMNMYKKQQQLIIKQRYNNAMSTNQTLLEILKSKK